MNISLPDLLPSWREGASRRAILAFVRAVTAEGAASFVPQAERVAVFDNDGTLWCEKPMYVQLDFALRRMAEQAEQDPALRELQPWKAAYERDYAWLGAAVTSHYQGDDTAIHTLLGGLLRAFDGMSVEAFEAASGAFLRSAPHPTLGRPYRGCVYRPMIELLRYLEANGFTNYIASGGGRDFMRALSMELYGIPRERVIGSSAALRFVADELGGSLVHKAALEVLDDGPEKPVRIWSRVGRRPILAAGNSDGDIPMLQFAAHQARPALRLLVDHDDAEREFAYSAGAERALGLAGSGAWARVSMRDDWTTIFP